MKEGGENEKPPARRKIMCTSIALTTGDFYFGRNLDLEYSFGEQVAVTPRQYPIVFRKAGECRRHHAMIGMATVVDGYPLYAEAANEKGLCIAGLNFPENAFYPAQLCEDKANVSPFELPLWVLGQCASVEEARALLNRTHIVDIPFSDRMPLAPLHWHIADRERSIVVECMQSGMRIYDNPVGVLTNNPPFDFQLTNLRQYMGIRSGEPDNSFGAGLALAPFGRGFGTLGLPGDFSPASRFVKAAFLRLNSVCEGEENSSVSQFFHLLDAVAMPRGAVRADDRWDITTYSCCINANKGVYYYKTYDNSQITAVDMHHEDLESGEVKRFALETGLRIAHAN